MPVTSGQNRLRTPIAVALAAAAVSCAHAGPDTCGGYQVERQWDARFRITVTAKVTEPPRWRLDDAGNPSPASFGGDGVTGTTRLRFLVEDPDALFAELRARGVECHPNSVGDKPWGTREFALYDPDRNALTFHRHLTAAEKQRVS